MRKGRQRFHKLALPSYGEPPSLARHLLSPTTIPASGMAWGMIRYPAWIGDRIRLIPADALDFEHRVSKVSQLSRKESI